MKHENAFAALSSGQPKSISRAARRHLARAVEALEPRTMLSTVPNDPMFSDQWHLNNTGQFAVNTDGGFPSLGTPGVDIDAERAWDYTTGSHNVVVAVLDTGLDTQHPDILPNLWTNPGEVPGNGIDDDRNGFVDDVHGWNFGDNNADVTDFNGHGTHVAGTIGAAGNNGIGVTGVNWNVQILPIKLVAGASGGLSSDAILAGFHYMSELKHQGVNIVAANASFGGPGFPFNRVEAQALEYAREAGILVVVAAGNDSANNDINQDFPSKFTLTHPNVISVACTDNQDNLSFFSNFGTVAVNVGSPGQAITSTWSRYVDEKDNASGQPVPDGIADGELYQAISGTSMASPVVAGIIALEAAANPLATPQQLKTALFNSVEIIPSLDLQYNLPDVVSTKGRVNALYAVRNIQNQFATADFSSGGNWVGQYGSQGHFIVGADTLFPDFVGVILTGGAGHMVAASSTDARMLQVPSNPADRVGAYFTTPDVMTFDMDFKDTAEHRVGLYMADLENLGRTQEVRIIDKATSRVLDYRGISDFAAGRYLFWDLKGSVQIQVRSTRPGLDAVVNGFVFDAPPTNPSQFVDTDTTTQGRWINNYGAEGQFVVGQSQSFPSLVGVNLTGGTGRVVTGKKVAKDPAAPQRIDDPTKNQLAYFATPTTMTFDLNFTGTQVHRMALYAVDFEKAGRAERIELIDPSTNSVITDQNLADFSSGKYLLFDVSGHVQLRITRLSGPDAVVSGFFFDAPGQTATLVGTDTHTGGSWIGHYGAGGSFVFGDSVQQFPWFANTTISNGTTQVINARTGQAQALQRATNPTQRLVGYLNIARTATIDMNIIDNQTHRVSIYAVDYDKQKRREKIEVVDATTGQVLSSQEIRDFSKGVYLTWDIRNHVQFRITRLEGPTAVISGIFFG